ncbi:hypothetical protein EVAR_17392_1 [Eumeta japonica]|uniref:Uncharacterized protein n=1 Tax=Eumeta variegata TaxID=151549 RepID=A0A4C1V9Q3_EUMVA|nr:hypothetical protein EVAR_17392_1 [Eumeta japonica]
MSSFPKRALLAGRILRERTRGLKESAISNEARAPSDRRSYFLAPLKTPVRQVWPLREDHVGTRCQCRSAREGSKCINCTKAGREDIEHRAFSAECGVRHKWD